MLMQLHTCNKITWVYQVMATLYLHGFDCVWENQGVGNSVKFLQSLKERLCVGFSQDWLSTIHNSTRYHFYSTFKTSLLQSSCLTILCHIGKRDALLKFRLGVSCLNSHKLRFSTDPNASFDCPFCKVHESEIHFLFVCPKYAELREEFIPQKFVRRPSLHSFSILMASDCPTLVYRLATYIHKAFEIRNAVV